MIKFELEEPRKAPNGLWYVGVKNETYLYLRKDGKVRNSTGYYSINNGYWSSYSEAKKAKDMYVNYNRVKETDRSISFLKNIPIWIKEYIKKLYNYIGF